MLHELYSEPTSLLEDMIAFGELRAFVSDVVARKNERDAWDVYLSKVWNKSWADFSEEVLGSQNNGNNVVKSIMTSEQIVSLSLAVSGCISEGVNK